MSARMTSQKFFDSPWGQICSLRNRNRNTVAEARQHAETELNRRDVGNIFVWVLLAVYAFARVLQVYPGRAPMLAVVALHVLPPAIFAVIHGTRAYRLGGILTFVAITLIVGNFFENLGVQTAFPFGSYYFTDLMGPKLSAVPITLGLAYVGMAYLSWTLAGIIAGEVRLLCTGCESSPCPCLRPASWFHGTCRKTPSGQLSCVHGFGCAEEPTSACLLPISSAGF
jgi:Carotenoid biosynthesis protein